MAKEPLLRFGVEVEMILNSRQTWTPETLFRTIAKSANLKMHAVKDEEQDSWGPAKVIQNRKYKEWVLAIDDTVKCVKSEPGYLSIMPLELTSLILHFDSAGTWRDEVRKAFHAIETYPVTIDSNESSNTHVHFSPGNGQHWEVPELREICYAISYFEGAFLALVPQCQRSNPWSKSIGAYNDKLGPGTTPQDRWNTIEKLTTVPDIVEFMCPNDDRMFAWNFTNLWKHYETHYTGWTIEWRLAPGVKTAEGCLMWAELALNFVQAARQLGTHERLKKEKPTVQDLKGFVYEQVGKTNGASKLAYLEPVFNNRTGRCEPRKAREKYPGTEKYPDDPDQLAMLQKLRNSDNRWGHVTEEGPGLQPPGAGPRP